MGGLCTCIDSESRKNLFNFNEQPGAERIRDSPTKISQDDHPQPQPLTAPKSNPPKAIAAEISYD